MEYNRFFISYCAMKNGLTRDFVQALQDREIDFFANCIDKQCIPCRVLPTVVISKHPKRSLVL